jgi:hypothetical protein
MVTGADPGDLGDIIINGVKYPVAVNVERENPGIAFWRPMSVIDQHTGPSTFGPGQPIPDILSATYIIDRQMGVGRTRSSREHQLGVYYTINMDDSNPHFIRLAPTKYAATPGNAPTDAQTYFFEEDIAGTLNVYYSQRYTTRNTVHASTHAITVASQTDQTADAVAGQPWKHNGVWQIPLGPNEEAVRLTTPPTTFNDYTGSPTNFSHFAAIMDANTPKLAGAVSNTLRLVEVDPHSSTWGDAFSVGDTTSKISCIHDTGLVLLVAKEDNLFIWSSESGKPQPVFNIGAGKGQATNGVGLTAIPGVEMAAYNHDSGLHFLVGTTMMMNRGIDGIPGMMEMPNVTLEPFKGTVYETATVGNWFYYLNRVVESSSTRTYIVGADLRTMFGDPESMIQHIVGVEESWVRGLYVDSQKRLWYVVNGTVAYRKLGRDGSPYAGRDSYGQGAASATHTVFFEESDFGLPTTTKIFRQARVLARNIDSDCPIQIVAYMDGGSATNVGATITSNGMSNRFWTNGTNDSGVAMRLAATITTTSGFDPTTDDPQIWAIEVDMLPVPDTTGLYRWIIDTGDEYKNGGYREQDAKTMLDALSALEMGTAVTVTDPDGNDILMNILIVQVRRTYMGDLGAMEYEIEVLARERRTS